MSEKDGKSYCALHDSYGDRLDKVEGRQNDIRDPDCGILVKIASTQKWLKGYLAAVMIIILGGYYYTNVVSAKVKEIEDRQHVVISRIDTMGDVKTELSNLRNDIAELKTLLIQDRRKSDR